MKGMFWSELLVTIFVFIVFIVDLCIGKYILAIIMGILFVIDLILTILYGIEAWL